jgi:hypothetical protein
MRKLAIRLIPIAIAGIFVWFQFLSSEKFTNETGRKVHLALSPEQEEALGIQSYREVLAESDTIRSGPQYELVRDVAMRLSQAHTRISAGRFPSFAAIKSTPSVFRAERSWSILGFLPVAQTPDGLATGDGT